MGIKEHHAEFRRIVKKYGLEEESKAEEIADFLTKHPENVISAVEFARLFSMDVKDAVLFLSFIRKGIEFRESSGSAV